jgi:hypothetical protein
MTSFRLLQSHLKLLSNNDFAETRSEGGFNAEFKHIFGEKVDIFTNSMLDNVNQLKKHLATEEFYESMTTFRVLEEQFQQFINYDCEDVSKYFLEYTGITALTFKGVLLLHMNAIVNSITKLVHHRLEYEIRELKIQEEQVHKVDIMECNETESEVQNDNSRLGNDTDANCAEIIPIYDTEPNFDKEQMVEVQSTVDHIMPTNEKQQCEQPNFSNEGEVDQNVVQCLEKHSESESLPDNLMTETSNQTLESENILLKKTIA